MSFFGGGTDHPSWFRENGGAVLSTSIDKYIYLQMRRLPRIFDYNYRVAWSKIEQVQTPADIQHPVVRAVLQEYWKENRGLEIVYNADLPARSGLGSSSAFTVSILQGLWAEQGMIVSKRELSEDRKSVV
jgi:D-glycero-alpha-D-manno-heptose-7-phosphate kinase